MPNNSSTNCQLHLNYLFQRICALTITLFVLAFPSPAVSLDTTIQSFTIVDEKTVDVAIRQLFRFNNTVRYKEIGFQIRTSFGTHNISILRVESENCNGEYG